MVKMISREWCACVNDYRCEYVVDTDADFDSLPTCATGSTALSVQSGTVKMVNASGEWAVFGG